MRSVFPALHDRHLAALLCGAVILLAVAIFAISVVDRDQDTAPKDAKRALIRFTGASPAN
ncbi:MAG: hypothetical protein ACJA0P_004193 [Planctomycetota bacterium]|jgi:hypothetical protein